MLWLELCLLLEWGKVLHGIEMSSLISDGLGILWKLTSVLGEYGVAMDDFDTFH